MNKLEVGTRVRVKNYTSKYEGRIGKIKILGHPRYITVELLDGDTLLLVAREIEVIE